MAKVEESILRSISKHGFPEKKVSLPFQDIFKSCKKNNTSLSTVLKNLADQQVYNEKTGDRILFFSQEQAANKPQMNSNGIPEELYEEAMNKIKSMNPKDVEEIRKNVMNMSPEEKENMLKQAKELFGQKKK